MHQTETYFIKASQEYAAQVSGGMFRLITSPVSIDIRTDNTPYHTYRQNQGAIIAFKNLRLKNNSTADVTIELMTGDAKDSEFTDDVKHTQIPPTIGTCDNISVVDKVSPIPSLTIPGILTLNGVNYRRKSIKVTNLAPTLFTVRVGFGNSAFGVANALATATQIGKTASDSENLDGTGADVKKTTWQAETDDTVFIQNNNIGNSVNCRIEQIWYLA